MSTTTIARIHIARHAEGLHNLHLERDPSHPEPAVAIADAPLSQRGFDAAHQLGLDFVAAESDRVGVILSSPLRRTIQTSLTAFHRILDLSYYAPETGRGVQGGVKLFLDADLQEISALPCNTGSTMQRLISQFPTLRQQIAALPVPWPDKTGIFAPIDSALEERRQRILVKLEQAVEALTRPDRQDVLIVTHDGIISLLAPRTKVDLGKWTTLSLVKQLGGELRLVP